MTLIREDELMMADDPAAWRAAVVREMRSRSGMDASEAVSRPLWLTQAEAEALLALCVLSPADAGSCEEKLFGKLGDYFRSFR